MSELYDGVVVIFPFDGALCYGERALGVPGWSSRGGRWSHGYLRRVWQSRQEDTGRITGADERKATGMLFHYCIMTSCMCPLVRIVNIIDHKFAGPPKRKTLLSRDRLYFQSFLMVPAGGQPPFPKENPEAAKRRSHEASDAAW